MKSKKDEKDLQTETVQSDEQKDLTVEDLITKLAELQLRAESAEAKALEWETNCATLEQKSLDMTDTAQRVQAEFDNYRRRTNENNARLKSDACAEVISKILPVADVIDQALTLIDDENVKKGVSMIKDEVLKIFASFSVTEIESVGCEFDPRCHEAIMQVPAEKEEDKDTVKEVFQKGYKMGDKVIRPARVIINK